MFVTQGLSIVATHGNQPLRHLVNLRQKKRTGALLTDANGMNTGLHLTTQKIAECNTITQQIRPKSPNRQTKNH